MQNIILYGAGAIGKRNYDFLKYRNMQNYVYAFCDQDATTIKQIDDKNVYTYEQMKNLGIPFILSIEQTVEYSKMEELLKKDNQKYYKNLDEWAHCNEDVSIVAWNRDYCAFFHIASMNAYFDRVESETALNTFWKEDSPFYEMFQKLDLDNIIELACGRGRHVQKYISKAKHITLVDILENNIDLCKQRFLSCSNISYYKNDGFDLKELKSGEYTALFTYDSMVHFELLDIYSYLLDIYRVFKPGSYALFHHSNMSDNYKISFQQSGNPGGRNYMSKELFAYISYRAGFDVVEQRILDWSLPNMDCITLIKKPL